MNSVLLTAVIDTLRLAVRALRASKLRSALTLLGIVIGVAAVIAMAGVIEGLRRDISRELDQLGAGVFQVQKQPAGGFGPRRRAEDRKDFTLRDVDLLQQQCATCLHVGGEAWDMEGRVSSSERSLSQPIPVVGGTEAFFINNGFAIADGRFFTESEARTDTNVVVVGADIVDLLFREQPALGNFLSLRGQRYRVIGVMARRGQQMGGSLDNLAVIPIASFLSRWGSDRSLNVTISAANPARLGRTQDEVVALLRTARGVPPEAENDFDMFSNESMQESFAEITGAIAAASISICAIALLIGGIGVMNIMLVSVTERTPVIGLRRALGARRRRVLWQLLTEAVMLTLVGGLMGIFVGWSITRLVGVLVQIPTVVPLWAIIVSLLAAALVGVVFGFYPAVRASRLDPALAMRRE